MESESFLIRSRDPSVYSTDADDRGYFVKIALQSVLKTDQIVHELNVFQKACLKP